VESGAAARALASSSNHAVNTEPALSEREERWREERVRYMKALEATKYPSTGRWNIHAAARELGMPRKTLTYRLRKLRLLI
jgi:transcriptional regulator with GAF, ATPase, and Fis domain